MLARHLSPRILRSSLLCRASSSSTISKASSSATTPSSTPTPTEPPSPTTQAPNRAAPWSTSQRTRADVQSGPRFEQTVLGLQPQPSSAMELLGGTPVRVVQDRKAVCDGGGGPLGHPKIYINLDDPGIHSCGYCGLRFQQAPHRHAH